MSLEVATRLSNELASYLDLATSELKLTAANMANIDTPGYQALGFDFEAEMRRAMSTIKAGGQFSPASIAVDQVDGLIERPDGNDVSMDREGLNMAEAQLRFKTGVALIKHEYSAIMDAIHADK